jgi:hypothetical protein
VLDRLFMDWHLPMMKMIYGISVAILGVSCWTTERHLGIYLLQQRDHGMASMFRNSHH